jgi:hypothetical protein
VTALTLYKTATPDTLLTAALQLSTSAPAAETSVTPVTFTKNVIGKGLLPETGSLAAFAAGASEPAPNGTGQLFDSTSLVGQTVAAGTYQPSVKYNTNQSTITGTLHHRVYKWNSSTGVYTLIAKYALAVTLTTTATVFNTGWTEEQTGAAMAFGANEYLYVDDWIDATAIPANINLRSWRNGGASESLVTPGYGPTTVDQNVIPTGVPSAAAVGVPTVARGATTVHESGAYLGSLDPAVADAFALWRGNPVAKLSTYPFAPTWAAYEAPSDAVTLQGTAYAGARWFVNLKPFPVSGGAPLGNWADAAAGLYDVHWFNLFAYLVAHGHANADAGWAHEHNGNWSAWSVNPGATGIDNGGVDQSDNFVAAFLRMETQARAAGFTGRLFLSPSNGTTGGLPDPAYIATQLLGHYAGVLAHQYDRWDQHDLATTTEAQRWSQILTGGGKGYQFWGDFCATNQLVFGSSEYGLWNSDSVNGDGSTKGGGGDDPAYLTDLYAFWATQRARGVMTLGIYLNSNPPDGGHYIGPGDTVFANAAARYVELESALGGAQVVTPTGIASAEAVGAPTVAPGPVAIVPAGIASAEAVGAPTVAPGPVAIVPAGIASAEAVGAPTLTTSPGGHWDGSQWADPVHRRWDGDAWITHVRRHWTGDAWT